MLVLHGRQGQAQVVLAEAHGSHGGLDGDGVDLGEEGADELEILALHGRGAGHVSGEELVAQLRRLLGQEVRKHRDDALAAHGEDGHDLVVVAGVDVQLVAQQRLGLHNGGDVAVGLLDGGDVGMLRQLHIGGGLDGRAGAGGDVVENEGLGGGVGDSVVHGHQAVLGGLIIVGCHHQAGVGAGLAGKAGEVDGVGRVVGAGAGDDGHPAGGALHGEGDGVAVLFVGEGGALAGGAADHQGVDSLVNLPVDKPPQLGKINAVGGKRGNEGCGCASKDRFLGHGIRLLFHGV